MIIPKNWNDEVYVGDVVPTGYRLLIDPAKEAERPDLIAARRLLQQRIDESVSPLDPIRIPGSRIPRPITVMAEDSPHRCGGGLLGGMNIAYCPNCKNPMFAIFQFDLSDERINTLQLWRSNWLHILVCPFCLLYMEPYWAIAKQDGFEFVGGLRDGGAIYEQIVTPYQERGIKLLPLSFEDFPLTEANSEALDARWREPRMYHQIGGLPPIGGYDEMECCVCDEPMHYGGVVDYDDENVPLYESDSAPVALSFCDLRNLNFFTCPNAGFARHP